MAMRWEGSAMLRRSPHRTVEAIVTQAVALIVALGKTDLLRDEAGAIKSIELPSSHAARGGGFLAREVAVLIKKSCGGEVGRRNESRSKQRWPSSRFPNHDLHQAAKLPAAYLF